MIVIRPGQNRCRPVHPMRQYPAPCRISANGPDMMSSRTLSMKIATNRRPTPTYVMPRRYQQMGGSAWRRSVRAVEELDGVDDLDVSAQVPQAGGDLHGAAGVRAGDHTDPRVAHRCRLLPHELP